ncbi:MAG: glycoside hydrolase, partial [Clostridia bacterium]|nr:glycoside hydrolase [Clostridia bacterium]
KGEYEVKLMKNSHEIAQTNVGNAITKYTVSSDIFYTEDSSSGAEIRNLFGSDSSDGFAVDGSDSGNEIRYMTRANFAATFPVKQENRTMSEALRNKVLYTQADATAWLNNHSDAIMPVTGANNGKLVYENGEITELGLELGKPENFDNDELWDEVLDQLTVTEMQNVVLHGYLQETGANKLTSIGKKANKSVDGPAQIGSFNQASAGTGFPMPTVLAQTWNAELARSFGTAVGAEAQNMGYTGWYAPGINLHRSAFGGRNYEYFSEDTVLTGKMAAAVVKGALNTGTYLFAKHFIGYDQESYRDSLYCWMTEQALREVYLKPFKIAIEEGGLTGIMTSYGRIGAVWSGGSEALLTDLLRNEWGFNGTVLSDYSDHQEFMNGDQMIRNGGDIWMDDWQNGGRFRYEATSAAMVSAMRTAVKHTIYTRTNAEYVASQYDPASDGITITKGGADGSWWIWILVGVDAALVASIATMVAVACLKKDKIKP